ncbi:MAG: hypothetical protein KGL74_13555 [Elusimicrobia bacterium]|nr:hypothetical protein [Elusimicrobiota bacterium]MDE2512145.1 hypothetical protein [Elusimicrobiota bacterium]
MDRTCRRAAIAALCVPLILASAASAAPAPAPAVSALVPVTAEQLKSVDGQIAAAESIVVGVENLSKGGADGSFCPDGVSAATISRDMKIPGLKGAGGILAAAVGNDSKDYDTSNWERYYICRAVATRSPDVCRMEASNEPPNMVTHAHPEQTAQDRCMSWPPALTMYRDLVTKNPAFIAECETVHASERQRGGKFETPAARRRFCRAMFAYDGNPEPVVAAAPAGAARAEILHMISVAFGDPKLCPTLGYKTDQDLCREYASFVVARSSGKESDCYGGLCRVLLGKPVSACEDYMRDIRRKACKAVYAPRYADEQARKFDAVLRQVSGALKNATGDAATLAGINERLDKIYALKDRLIAAGEKIMPKKMK